MTRTQRRLFLVPAVLLTALVVGCSFSYSSRSSSKSSRSSSISSSSSSPGHAGRVYQEDVREYTAAYVLSGGNIDAFRTKIAELAEEHGIADWESNLITYEGIGEGLADANATDIQLRAFKENLGGGDPAKAKAIQDGFDAAD